MKRVSPMVIVFITAFINMLGVGIILPLLPYYVKIIEESNNPLLAENRAIIVGALVASYSLFQFLGAPVLGAISDRIGRRPVLLVSIGGTAFSYLLLGLADQFIIFGAEAVIAMLFVARILDGITGGNISTLNAYIADTTPPDKRTKGLGMIGAAFGLGFMLGPALGGLLSTISLNTPAFLAAGVSAACVLFGLFALPESLPPSQRTNTPLLQMNPLTQLRTALSHQAIRPIFFGVFLFQFAFAGLQSNFAVFTDTRFGFTPLDNAMIFVMIGLLAIIVQGFLISHAVALLGEARLALMGLTLSSISFGLIPFVPESWMLFPVVALLAIGNGLTTPSLTSLVSQRVAETEQGRVLGAKQALLSLTSVFGPLYAGFVFDTVNRAMPYLSGVVFILLAMLTLFFALRTTIFPDPPINPDQSPMPKSTHS